MDSRTKDCHTGQLATVRYGSLLLPLLLSPSLADTTRNRLVTVEIDHYRPTTAGDDRIDRYQSISRGNGQKQLLLGGTTR
ncbi:hypothetical protein B296_00014574 [Ensete ventricosum]|uniref:Uncharacterized protein n=1 Tax=Ensete ventricosum TaxID=4639 RepID=A0A427B7I5_ENSVE|nr:hypothetical protein B296_00014574 [Ensete ventricosum]